MPFPMQVERYSKDIAKSWEEHEEKNKFKTVGSSRCCSVEIKHR